MFTNLLLIIAALAQLPILLMYSRVMWNKGHYQFFPLLFCAVGWLLYSRLSKHVRNENGTWLAVALLLLNLIFVFLSIAVYTPVSVIPTLIIFLCAVVLDRYGFPGLWIALPVIAILLFVTKLPTGRDLFVINELQFLASQLASWILDSFGIIHFREGVILVTEKNQFFTEEACSGIRSLFSTLAAVSIYGLSRTYSASRQIFNLLQSIVWVIAGNAIRVASVVYLADNGFEQFSQGTLHQMFGLATFIGIFGVTLSVDRVIDIFSRGFKQSAYGEYDSDMAYGDIVESEKSESELQKAEIKPEIPKPKLVNFALISLYVLVILFSTRLTYAKWNNFDRVRLDISELAPIEESQLPPVINQWKLTNFELKVRGDDNLFAPESYLWIYQWKNLTATVSFDAPYPEFHDLSFCYRGIGWEADLIHTYPKNSEAGRSLLELSKPSQHGVVYFAGYSKDGKLVRPANEFSPTTRFIRNIEMATGRLAIPSGDVNRNGEALPISQIQILVQSAAPITDDATLEIENLFDIVRKRILSSPRFSN
ncbi:MAG: exosortase U [Pirellulales bacterium]